MNPDVKGDFLEESVEKVIMEQKDFLKKYNFIVATDISNVSPSN